MSDKIAELQRVQKKLLATLKLARMNSWEWDLKTRTIYMINAADPEVMGRISPLMAAETAVVPNYPQILMDRGIIEGVGVPMVEKYTKMIYQAEEGVEYSFRLPFKTMTRETVWIQFVGVTTRDAQGQPDTAIGYYTDVTAAVGGDARQYSARELLAVEQEKQDYMLMVDGLTVDYANVMFADLDGDTYMPFRMNDITETLVGNPMSTISSFRQMIGYYIDHYVVEEDREVMRAALQPDRIRELLQENHYFNINYRSERLGEMVYCQLKVASGKAAVTGRIVLGFRNIDEEYRSRQTLLLQSRTDALTGLLNKRAMWEDVKQALCSQSRQDIVFMFLDLDHFKDVNDKLGHMQGDEALRDAAAVLRTIFRRTDIIGRFGGDEFCVFLTDIPRGVTLTRIEQCLEGLRRSYSNETDTVHVTTSIGVAYFHDYDSTDADELIRLADEALYEAKESGRDRYVVHYY